MLRFASDLRDVDEARMEDAGTENKVGEGGNHFGAEFRKGGI